MNSWTPRQAKTGQGPCGQSVLFLAAGVFHVAWMDVFALHITIHFIPAPLAVLFVVFAVTLGSWVAATLGRRTFAVGGLVVVLAVFMAALSFADEPPASMQDLRRDPRLAFVRPLAGSETTVAASSRVTSAFVAPLDVAPTAGGNHVAPSTTPYSGGCREPAAMDPADCGNACPDRLQHRAVGGSG